MRIQNVSVTLIICMICLFHQSSGQTKVEFQKADIKTSAICGTCKGHIDKALKNTEGVQKAKLNLDTKIVSVTYNPAVTDLNKIRKAISLAGYDADDLPADSAAYQKLDKCCQKDGKME